MEADLLRRFLHRTREWSRAQNGAEVLTMASTALSEFAEADSGFFVYQTQDFSSRDEHKPMVYLPWGVFSEDANGLQELVDASLSHFEELLPAWERWILAEDMPLHALHVAWEQYPLLEFGIWPLTSRERTVGAIVVVRTKSVSNRMTPQMGTAIVDACAAQVSVALDMILAIKIAEEASQLDLLTGLFNRRGLETHLPKLLQDAKRNHRHVVFGIMDLDALKETNDIHGHPAGDELLQQLAVTIRNHLRKGDLACRYGGDEFVVVLQCTEDTTVPLERVQRAIEASGVSVSMGSALWEVEGKDLQECYRIADERLYESKRSRGLTPRAGRRLATF